MTYSKEEREKHKSILVATLNYLLQHHADDMVFDEYSPSKEWYLSEMKRTDIDIKKYRSMQIKNRLDRHISQLKYRYDLGLNHYIKLNTGYDIDIFEEFKENVMPIILKGSIEINDVYWVENYLKAYGADPKEKERVVFLKNLLAEHQATIEEMMRSEEVITQQFVSMTQGKKSWILDETAYKEWKEEECLLSEEIAPSGLCKLSVETSGKGDWAQTYVNISLQGGVGAIYSAKGDKLPIRVYWKDDRNVIIETKKKYDSIFRYSQVSSYGEVVKIEYHFS